MKKILLLVLMFLVTFSVWSLKTSAEEGAEDGLAPGEVVVDTFSEVIEENIFSGGSALEPLTPTDDDDPITINERRLSWYPVTKTYMGEVGSPWYYAGASTISGGTLHASHSSSVAHTFTGQLEAPLSRLTAYIGFETTRSFSATVGYSSKEYPSGKYRLDYQHRYAKYQVKQQRKYDSRASVVYGTAYVYPQKWIERRYRVVKLP